MSRTRAATDEEVAAFKAAKAAIDAEIDSYVKPGDSPYLALVQKQRLAGAYCFANRIALKMIRGKHCIRVLI